MGETPLGWYRWYPRDFLASATVRKMSYCSQGIYRALLDLQWETGVPLSYLDACLVLRLSENEKQEFEPFFDVCFPNGINAKLMEQRHRQTQAIKAQSEAGKRGGRLGGKGRSGSAQGSVRGTSNQTETETETDNKKTKGKKSFSRPTCDDVRQYMTERGWVNPDSESARFVDYYEVNGWRVGRNSMKDWQAAVRTWEARAPERVRTPQKPKEPVLGVDYLLDEKTGKRIPMTGVADVA